MAEKSEGRFTVSIIPVTIKTSRLRCYLIYTDGWKDEESDGGWKRRSEERGVEGAVGGGEVNADETGG